MLTTTLVALAMFAAPVIDEAKLVDLSHTLDAQNVFWPTEKPFQRNSSAAGKTAGGYWYASGNFASSEHLGTHIDSPIHFGEGKPSTEAIPLAQLVGPVIVIDIARQCAGNPDYRLSAEDISAWEKVHGRIAAKSIVLVKTGWAARWPNRLKYMGSDKPGDTANLHFPGISPEAAQALVERRVDGVGIDTASLDHGPSKDFRAHQILNGAGIYGLENVASLERIPPTGATLIALPVKIKGGTGGPVRIVAILP
jgi:kynurenine formamidase